MTSPNLQLDRDIQIGPWEPLEVESRTPLLGSMSQNKLLACKLLFQKTQGSSRKAKVIYLSGPKTKE